MKPISLIDDPWIEVFDARDFQTKTVSLSELFANAQHYRQLAGDTHAQDLAMLRLLEAILLTVYSRRDADGKPYEWLTLNEMDYPTIDKAKAFDQAPRAMLQTWQTLFQRGRFTDDVVNYLNHYRYAFSFGGDGGFCQVPTDVYNLLSRRNVPSEWSTSTTGTVVVKQLNRRVSESNNSRAIFAAKSSRFANRIEMPELARWLLAYQGFTGVTDKTKLDRVNEPVSKGWLYGFSPVYARGKNLFETLMLNLTLGVGDAENPWMQKPVWEYDPKDYVAHLVNKEKPVGAAEVYTSWARMLHVEWNDAMPDLPKVYTTGLPKLNDELIEQALEPMAVWQWRDKDEIFKPFNHTLNNISQRMWRHFGLYFPTEQNFDRVDAHVRESGVVRWLKLLKRKGGLPADFVITLNTIELVDNGDSSSRMPAFEICDTLGLDADLAVDENGMRIVEQAIEFTNQVGKYYWHLASNLATLRTGSTDLSNKTRAAIINQTMNAFYESLNEPFVNALSEWTPANAKAQLKHYQDVILPRAVDADLDELLLRAAPRDLIGKVDPDTKQTVNLYTLINRFKATVNKYKKGMVSDADND